MKRQEIETATPPKLYMAKVSKQRDNGPATRDVCGLWVASSGFENDVRKAQIFRSEREIKQRLPLLWEFEIYEYRLASDATAMEKTGYNAYATRGSEGR